MNWATVEDFRNWWVKQGWPLRPPFREPIFFTDNAMSLCLYREGCFQVELYVSEPNSVSPPHTHPGVDSCFIYLTGNIEFNMEGREHRPVDEFQKPGPTGLHMLFGKTISSPDGIPHWLKIGPEGGAFLSFEKWKDKDPVSVTTNWKGDPVGKQHAEILRAA